MAKKKATKKVAKKAPPKEVTLAPTDIFEEMREQGYVTPEEAARISRVAQSTIYAWAREGALGDVKRHGRRRIFVSLEALRELAGDTMEAVG
jgi:hypothetical protein